MYELRFAASRGLGASAITGLQGLLDACAAKDKFSIPENFDKNFNIANMDSWFLAYDGDELCGMISIFAPDPLEAELIAAVHPDWRRNGVFGQLLEMAEKELKEHGYKSLLFANHPAARLAALAAANRGARYEFSEYTLVFESDIDVEKRIAECCKTLSEASEKIAVRKAAKSDAEAIAAVLANAFAASFEEELAFVRHSLDHEMRSLYVLTYKGKNIACIGHVVEEDGHYINAFAVDKAYQTKGYGKMLLAYMIAKILESSNLIKMDVDSKNDSAFALYRSMGFKVLKSTDYSRLNL